MADEWDDVFDDSDLDDGEGFSGPWDVAPPEPLDDEPADDEEVVRSYVLDELDRKVVECFPGKVVRKDLTAMMRRGTNIPVYVLEYLLGMYCTTEDPDALEEGIGRIRKILDENYVRPDESELIKSKIREHGQYTVIDKLGITYDEYEDVYIGKFSNLGIRPFSVPSEYPDRYNKLLLGGIWCISRIIYAPMSEEDEDGVWGDAPAKSKKKGRRKANDPRNSPFSLASLTPIQMPNLDLDDIVAQRRRFTTEEWKEMLLRSGGYEPSELTDRERMHFLERMVPLIERNYNLVELGPRGTGKSHLYKEVSPYAVLISGGQTTTANLFGRINPSVYSNQAYGLLSLWDCCTFDEVAGMRFKDVNLIQTLKDYMASGSYVRGRSEVNADASLVFEGNINDTVANILKTTHLFEPFPPEFNNDSAFFDRIHCYLPGWEIPKMRSSLLMRRFGLITDCLAEFFHAMRGKDFTHHIDRFFTLNDCFNQRDEVAVRKTFSGLAKLVHPDGEMTKDDVRELLDYAIEGRRRVKEQLKTMAGIEFIDVGLGYRDNETGLSTIVAVPEQAEGSLVPEGTLPPGHVFSVGANASGEQAVYKLENKAVQGGFDFRVEGVGYSKDVRESLQAAFDNFNNCGNRLVPGMDIAAYDYLLFFNDVQGKGLSSECSLAEFVGLCSAAAGRPVTAQTVVPGVVRLSGTMDELRDLEDIFRVAKNAGAKRILLPNSSIAALQTVPADLLNGISPSFYPDGDMLAAARLALNL